MATFDSANHGAIVTPSDTTIIPPTKGILVGVSGALRVRFYPSGEDVIIPATCVPAGVLLPICVDKIFATSTAASSMVALW